VPGPAQQDARGAGWPEEIPQRTGVVPEEAREDRRPHGYRHVRSHSGRTLSGQVRVSQVFVCLCFLSLYCVCMRLDILLPTINLTLLTITTFLSRICISQQLNYKHLQHRYMRTEALNHKYTYGTPIQGGRLVMDAADMHQLQTPSTQVHAHGSAQPQIHVRYAYPGRPSGDGCC